MKRSLLITTILILRLSTSAQELTFSAYGGLNEFYNRPLNNDKLSSQYDAGFGQCYELSITGLGDFKLLPSFTVMVEHYTANVRHTYEQIFGGYTMNLDVDKTMLGIGVYPVNVRIYRQLYLRSGADFSFPLVDNTQVVTDYNFEFQSWTDSTDGADLSPDLIIGLSATIDYRFKLGKRMYFTPRYRFYYGLMPELEDIRIKVKSIRHQLGIGIGLK